MNDSIVTVKLFVENAKLAFQSINVDMYMYLNKRNATAHFAQIP